MRDTSGVYEVDQNTGAKSCGKSAPNELVRTGQGRRPSTSSTTPASKARRSNVLTVFADEAGPPFYGSSQGAGAEAHGRAVKLVHAYENAHQTVAVAEGGMQVLPHGEAMVSFGATQYIAEFAKNGEQAEKPGGCCSKPNSARATAPTARCASPGRRRRTPNPRSSPKRKAPGRSSGLRELERRHRSGEMGSARGRRSERAVTGHDSRTGATSRRGYRSRAPTRSSR